MYFSAFPKTTYTINNKTEIVVDIFRKVALSLENKNNIFIEEFVEDSDNIESLAEKYYGDPTLSWIILLTNNIVDPINELSLSTKNFDSLINTKYSGSILYFEENIDLQQGDVLIYLNPIQPNPIPFSPYPDNRLPTELQPADLDVKTYAFVNSYDKEFRYCRITNVNGEINVNDKVAAFRKINDKLQLITFKKKFTNTSLVGDYFVLPIKLKTDYKNAPKFIYNELNQIISPYRKYIGGELKNDYTALKANGIYSDSSDDNAFRDCLLYQLIMLNTPIQNLNIKSILQDLSEKNEKFRKIKILNKEFILPFIETFEKMISSDDIRSRVITRET